MNPEVEARWVELRQAIERDLGDAVTVARVPTWPPTTVEAALKWAPTTLWMKVWEFGDDEPTWDDVKATPVAPSNPSNDVW